LNKSQIFLLAASLLAIFCLFYFGRTTEIKTVNPVINVKTGEFDTDRFLNLQKQKLLLIPRDSLKLLWKNNGIFASASEISYRKAAVLNTAKAYEEAGNKLFKSFNHIADSAAKVYLVDNAQKAFSKAHSLDSTFLDAKMNEAEILIDVKNQIMPGVQILLSIVRKYPNNVRANITLARLAVVSGQFEKAFERLNKLIKLNPKNAEAYYVLAGAYESKGDIANAIKNYRLTMQYIKDEKLKKQIEKYLSNLKNK